MQAPTLQLLCDSNPMCYGSSTAMLSILDHVLGERTALVHDVTAEVLVGDPGVDAVVRANVKDEEAVRGAIAEHHVDAVLVVSNRSCLDLYLDLGLPVFFVDILFWFGPARNHRIFTDAEAFFAQSFPGVDARGVKMQEPPITVGPLVRLASSRTPRRTGTLVQIGGAASRWIRPGGNSEYARYSADWIVGWGGCQRPLTYAAGRQAIASIPAGHAIREQAELATLLHGEMLDRLGSVRQYITTPGLNSVFEGLYANVPMLFLPPQNATQIAQLSVYEQAGLVAPGLNLPDIDPAFPRDWSSLGEYELTECVLRSLPRLAQPDTVRCIRDHLGRQMEELKERAGARAQFREMLGSPGGPAVAGAINTWWDEQWM